MASRGSYLLVVLALAGATACERGAGPQMRFVLSTPHENYQAQIRQLGLHATALGRDWIATAADVLAHPLPVEPPYREARYLDPARATAVAYRLVLERGQRLDVQLAVADQRPADLRLFLDLYHLPDSTSPPQLVASADSSGWAFDYVALRPGAYVLRVQPELLRGGRIRLTLLTRASLAFPVSGRDMAAIRSGFGAPRDAGRREHHGVDIFAPRGTPVLASVAGRVSRVRTGGGLGGNVVWLREARYGRSLYYAHLDRHAVSQGAEVKPGDTLGFVGNSGNARTTPPHLHFGIYMRGLGPVDPYHHLLDPPGEAPLFAGDEGIVGRWARVARTGTPLRAAPRPSAATLAVTQAQTPFEVVAGAGQWYLARLPDGRLGYLALADTRPLDDADSIAVSGSAIVRAGPTTVGGEIDSLAGGAVVPVLGRYGEFLLVRHPNGLQGWIGAGPSDDALPRAAGPDSPP
jgi:murein DD-endopeptidase MepM/ murein hydrolase activator NlpD